MTILVDGARGHVLASGEIDCVIVGADRITANGDVANKIGTYPLSVLAREHSVPFYVAAPLSTFDLTLPEGRSIPIEERGAEEVSSFGGMKTAPTDVKVVNPAFDVTPAQLITAIITERGIIRNVNTQTVADVLHDCP